MLLDNILNALDNHDSGLSFNEIAALLDKDYDTLRTTILRKIEKDTDAPLIELTNDTPQKVKLTDFGKLRQKKRKEDESADKVRDEKLCAENTHRQAEAEKARQFEETISKKLYDFFQKNTARICADAENHPAYIEFDMDAFLLHHPDGFDYALKNPEKFINKAEDILNDMDILAVIDERRYHVRMMNIPKLECRRLAEVRSVHTLNNLIAFDAVVMAASPIEFRTTAVTFECKLCGEFITLLQNERHFERPDECRCGCRKFDVVAERKRNEQILLLQEPEYSTGPVTIKAIVRDDLCDDFRAEKRKLIAGQRIRFTGIVKCESKYNNMQRLTTSVPYIYVHSYSSAENADIILSDADIFKIKEFAKDPDMINKINGMVAPHIYGYETEKEAIGLQLFGGVKKKNSRGNINILLEGDPSTAKTQMLKDAVNLALKGRFAECSNSSKIGLTACVRMDKTISNYVVEAGALVLSNGGLCALDELDKLPQDDEKNLNSAMESEEISLDKANIHITLPASCAILAAANPHTKTESFDLSEPLFPQIKFSKTFLSRFDIVFSFLDIPDIKKDRKIAHSSLTSEEVNYPIDPAFFKKYLYYASQIKPDVPEEFKSLLEKKYVELRLVPRQERITPRDLHALRRLSEASARERLSPKVEEVDVTRAIRIYGSSLRAQRKYREDELPDVDQSLIMWEN